MAHVLPPELNKKILEWKTWMQDHYNCRNALKSPAHITLVPPFWMDPSLEAGLIADMQTLITREPFTLHTNHFSAFPPRTLFVALEASDALNKLKIDTDVFIRQHPSYPMKADTRPFHPHITIATRDLMKKDFAEAWPHFANRKFAESWTANSISLLKHNKKNWDVVHTSQFQNIKSEN